MKKIIFLITTILLVQASIAQRNEFSKVVNDVFKVNQPSGLDFSAFGGQRELTISGLVPDSVFDKIVMKDYSKLGVISSTLPQTSLLFDITKKEMNINYSGFFSNESMLKSKPVAFNASATVDFDDEAKRSTFISEGKLAPNIKFSAGARFFLPALAKYWTAEKDKIKEKAGKLSNALSVLRFDQLAVNAQNKCLCNDTADAAYKTYECKLTRILPIDTCITGSQTRYDRFMTGKVSEQLQNIFMSAEFSKKIYRWISVDIEYARPSVNTLNRQNTIDTRLNTRVFNNTGFTISYNILDVYKKSSQYFVYTARYANSENTGALAATDVNFNRRIESQGNTTYYESKTKKAYDTTLLKDTRTLTLGADYYFFFKKVVGFSGSIRATLGSDAEVKRKIEFGILFPVVQKDKTKTVFTIYYSMKSISSDIINGRYPGELGFKIGVPINMFTLE